MKVLDGTQSDSTQAPPCRPVDHRDLGAELRGDQRGLVPGRPASDDHDPGHRTNRSAGRRPSPRPRRTAILGVHRVDAGVHSRGMIPVRSAPMALYAAYGSNMDPAHMLARCPSSPVAGTGWLPGWRLTFGGEDLSWDGALATVVEDPDSSVFVVLYDMAESDERTLDSWEGAGLGLYSKIRLRVHTLEGDVLAWLYALQAFEGGLPSARYLGVIADAAEAADAPAEYVVDIRTRPRREHS